MPYDDETIMTFGKYKKFPLKNIPKEYFENVWLDQKSSKPELLEYIFKNRERLKLKLKEPRDPKAKEILEKKEATFVPFICEKRTFSTEKLARESLKKIREAGGDHKKPIRVYECPDCSGWHLTSEPIEIFKRKQLSFK